MFFLQKPSAARAQAFLESQQRAAFSYSELGATRMELETGPAGYHTDRHRIRLGEGREVFERACAALRRWGPFKLGWVSNLTPDAPFEAGTTLMLLIRHFGFYSLIANRLVYVLEEPTRFGFGYGTLEGHAEQGEERFLVFIDEQGAVFFELFAFSKPRHPLAVLGTPLVRVLQAAASRGYMNAMLSAAQNLVS